jgi:hypothetical protein
VIARRAPWGRVVAVGLLACLSGRSAAAQIGAGRIAVVVTAPTGAALPGATITVTALATNLARRVVTADHGEAIATSLAPGLYKVQVELSGFKTVERTGVTVTTGETVRVEVPMELGALAETLTVRGDAPILRSETSGLGQVLDNQKVMQLPLNGRNFITLAQLVPGVTLPPGTLLPRINGGRPRTNEYLFDGISVLQPEPGQVAFYPIPDAIQEFKIETNSPPAEFGRFNGGVVNLTTKSGTNGFHGTGFDFIRNEAMNARNFFQTSIPDKPKFRRQQFGGVLGGPVVEDHTFFFFDYQGQRQNIARTVFANVPTALQRQGIFTEAVGGRVPALFDPASGTSNRTPFANSTIPMDRWDPAARALLVRYPMPTTSGMANNFSRTADEAVDQDQFDARVDHRFGLHDQAFARLTNFRETFLPVTPLPDGSGTATGAAGPQDTNAWSFASNYQHTFSAKLLNEFRFGDTRRSVARQPALLDGTVSSALGIPGIPTTAQFASALPLFSIAGYTALGSPANTASDFSTSVTEIADNVSWFKGAHAFKFGADLRWERLNVVQPPSPTGTFTFTNVFTDQVGAPSNTTGNALASFLLGQVGTFGIDLQTNVIQNRAHFFEFFAQDDWKVTDRITVNAGLRYTLNFPSTEANNQVSVFNLQTQQMEYAGVNGFPDAARDLQKNNFGPRLGIAARLTDKTVARVGYGLIWIEMAGITTPFTTPSFPFVQNVTQRTLDNVTPAFVLSQGPSIVPVGPTPNAGLGQSVFSVDRDLGSGYVQQWNASTQREITTSTAVEIAYVGSKITHVGIPDNNINQLTVEQLALGSQLTARVPNPFFGIIPRNSSLGDPTITYGQLIRSYPMYTGVSLYRNNVGTTIYHGLTAKVEQRLTHGVSFIASYTRSKLVDDASSVFDASIQTGLPNVYQAADSFNRALERDYSNGDMPHVFSASAVWNLPFGQDRAQHPGGALGALVNDWQLAGVLVLQSGMPIVVTQATNNNAFAGFGIQRPNINGDPELPKDERTPQRYFDTSVFSNAPQFTLGNASRNPVRGPGYRNVDLSLVRRVPTGRTTSLEVRFEVFNVFNWPFLGAPNGSFGNAAFGSITSAGDPRVIQLGIKWLF